MVTLAQSLAPALVHSQTPPWPHPLSPWTFLGDHLVSISSSIKPVLCFSHFPWPDFSPSAGIPSFILRLVPGALPTCCGPTPCLDECLLSCSCGEMQGTPDLVSKYLFLPYFYSAILVKPLCSSEHFLRNLNMIHPVSRYNSLSMSHAWFGAE